MHPAIGHPVSLSLRRRQYVTVTEYLGVQGYWNTAWAGVSIAQRPWSRRQGTRREQVAESNVLFATERMGCI
jgi:hypothetical protein